MKTWIKKLLGWSCIGLGIVNITLCVISWFLVGIKVTNIFPIGIILIPLGIYWLTLANRMQFTFTGLKDKNGKKIYEGDIIRLKWNK